MNVFSSVGKSQPHTVSTHQVKVEKCKWSRFRVSIYLVIRLHY